VTENIQRICVFCGANPGHSEVYANGAEALAREIAVRGRELIYGGGSVGLMGMVARTALEAGAPVTGIIPRALTTRELAGEAIGNVVLVDTMAERKERMLTGSDGFVVLPGGLGTLDELFETLTWGQLGIMYKPVGLLNINGYYDHVVQWVEFAVAEGFVRPHHRDLFVVGDTPAELIDRMDAYVPPAGLLDWRTAVDRLNGQ
jgi:uncharacterized protein (TIGR00730 family)